MAPRVSDFAGAPPDGVRRLMNELQELCRDAAERYVGELPLDDPDRIVRELGGSFKKVDEFGIQGGHSVTVLEGRNRREVVIYATGKRAYAATLYEPRIRRVK